MIDDPAAGANFDAVVFRAGDGVGVYTQDGQRAAEINVLQSSYYDNIVTSIRSTTENDLGNYAGILQGPKWIGGGQSAQADVILDKIAVTSDDLLVSVNNGQPLTDAQLIEFYEALEKGLHEVDDYNNLDFVIPEGSTVSPDIDLAIFQKYDRGGMRHASFQGGLKRESQGFFVEKGDEGKFLQNVVGDFLIFENARFTKYADAGFDDNTVKVILSKNNILYDLDGNIIDNDWLRFVDGRLTPSSPDWPKGSNNEPLRITMNDEFKTSGGSWLDPKYNFMDRIFGSNVDSDGFLIIDGSKNVRDMLQLSYRSLVYPDEALFSMFKGHTMLRHNPKPPNGVDYDLAVEWWSRKIWKSQKYQNPTSGRMEYRYIYVNEIDGLAEFLARNFKMSLGGNANVYSAINTGNLHRYVDAESWEIMKTSVRNMVSTGGDVDWKADLGNLGLATLLLVLRS